MKDWLADAIAQLMAWGVIGGMLFGVAYVLTGGFDTSGGYVEDDYSRPPLEQVAPTPGYRQPGDWEDHHDASQPWSCFFDPTMNYDWHDDVVCTNGVDTIRPRLLTGESFVDAGEMQAAAHRFENRLNNRLTHRVP